MVVISASFYVLGGIKLSRESFVVRQIVLIIIDQFVFYNWYHLLDNLRELNGDEITIGYLYLWISFVTVLII